MSNPTQVLHDIAGREGYQCPVCERVLWAATVEWPLAQWDCKLAVVTHYLTRDEARVIPVRYLCVDCLAESGCPLPPAHDFQDGYAPMRAR